ncbi:unnamed protein product [Spirodela intermedia]|uniref:C2 domain-containing protein n=1 Tax=Spirodela intermedia TaxID=51605 RepID=A0A7I8J5T2_SPIIN|nr:unnamed protein product [Spirodela intermedia]CAA6665370.1 unnamed protein product [Spirodela intermedia]CAA6674180.1 unnamed protein product [Spirodela intermedia]
MRDGRTREGLLKVLVIRGRNLSIRDLRSSDPYVVVSWRNKRVKTKVIKKNVNPEWNEDLTLIVHDPSINIKLEVFDKDTFTPDDPMGNVEINIQPLVEAGRADLGTLLDNDIIRIVSPDSTNCLVGESKIYIYNGKVVQDMILRLRDVECGEVELRLEWVNARRN